MIEGLANIRQGSILLRENGTNLHPELRPDVSVHVKMDIRYIPNTEAAVVLPNEVKSFFFFFFFFCFHCVFLLRLRHMRQPSFLVLMYFSAHDIFSINE
ncbi:hypothetical protein MKW98_022906 [Papaver atlanticum]|uniref:Uncharacterized protein n=1 Tax=Papaver atlanticum TaxID=357466 RepID=A0AAD4TMG8_9MAGN|nr:hypothetical protein MKW98_022906 [Papaver atlanticum]